MDVLSILKFTGFALALVIIAVMLVVAVAHWRWHTAIEADHDRLVAAAQAPTTAPITAEALASLPEPARRYLQAAGVVGQTIPRLVRLTQKGRIRSSNEAAWMTFEAEEIYSTNPPAFLWRAAFPTPAMPLVLGRDEYLDGQGSIAMKMLGLVSVADEHGDELRAAALMRYLNEMLWFPAAYLGPNVTIRPGEDADSFRVTIADRGLSATALIFVDASGRVVNFRAQRYNTGSRRIETWETPIAGWGTLAGLSLPTRGSAVWKLASGDLDYIDSTSPVSPTSRDKAPDLVRGSCQARAAV